MSISLCNREGIAIQVEWFSLINQTFDPRVGGGDVTLRFCLHSVWTPMLHLEYTQTAWLNRTGLSRKIRIRSERFTPSERVNTLSTIYP